MKLVNFSLLREPYAVELQALGEIWDLHNIAEYIGMGQDVPSNTFQMTWRIDPQYARRTYSAEQFYILFAEVEHLEVTSRDKELPYSEDDCVASLSRIGCTDPHGPFPEAIQGDDFHLDRQSGLGRRQRSLYVMRRNRASNNLPPVDGRNHFEHNQLMTKTRGKFPGAATTRPATCSGLRLVTVRGT